MLKNYELESKINVKRPASVNGLAQGKAAGATGRDADPQAWPFPEDWGGFC